MPPNDEKRKRPTLTCNKCNST